MVKPIKVFSIVGLTVAWLVWELWANFDHDPNTWPLTWVIVRYVPAWITLPAVMILAVWLPWHFIANYRDKTRTASRETLMTSPTTHTRRDAINRAVRTFIAGLWVDVSAAVVGALMLSLGDMHWTKAWATATVLLLAKTASTAVVSYVYRRVRPPAAVSSKTL